MLGLTDEGCSDFSKATQLGVEFAAEDYEKYCE